MGGVIMSLLFSCSDDDLLEQTNIESIENSSPKIELINLANPTSTYSRNVSSHSGKMLSFGTYQDFEDTLLDLEKAMEDNSDYITSIIRVGVTDEDLIEQKFAENNKIFSKHKVWNANFKRKDYYDGLLFTY